MSARNNPQNRFLSSVDLTEVTDEEDRLIVNGRHIEVEWVFQTERFKEHDGGTNYLWAMAYDAAGAFYGIEIIKDEMIDGDDRIVVQKLEGKRALTWFAHNASWDVRFRRELCRAIDNPQFEFMSLLSLGVKPKRLRKPKEKTQGQFHEQLHMATALVDCIRKLDAEPTIENLTDARRAVSEVHRTLHAPENYKLAAG